MNIYKNLILINNEDRTESISYCEYIKARHIYSIKYTNNKTYPCACRNIKWMKDPIEINPLLVKITNNEGTTFFDIKKILQFQGQNHCYWRIFFKNNKSRVYDIANLKIEENTLINQKAANIFDYYKTIARTISLKTEEGIDVLHAKYEKIVFISKDTVLSNFLTQKEGLKRSSYGTLLFPFGCNISQMDAVKNALSNQISIIEGPPGTGKTQTILNIIANVLSQGQTIAVVSNNNSATDNVFEKLQKHGFDYLTAQLGKSANKDLFISSKQSAYPDFSSGFIENSEVLMRDIKNLQNELENMLKAQNQIADFIKEFEALKIEKKYFDMYYLETYEELTFPQFLQDFDSTKLMDLWLQFQFMADENKKIGFLFKLKCFFIYGIKNTRFFNKPLKEVIPIFQRLYYQKKSIEMEEEIGRLKAMLTSYRFKEKMNDLSEKSLEALKSILANRFGERKSRTIFGKEVLWQTPELFAFEYPVILSTTHSVTSSLNNFTYDYVIVDEASQVDLVTGILAMSCAKNIVVVGDTKQLPNVIPEKTKELVASFSEQNDIPKSYRYEENSLLSSIASVFSTAPKTMLREHYRCHPKIINFCNQKFYNNQLIIMTKDKGEGDVLKVHFTVEGNHARGKVNQRQIDEIKENVLPELNSTDVGIIAPYNAQKDGLIKELSQEIDISTVHKFQGREKDDIIISTVDNEISEFTDNANMLNVAVSRAKNRLRLVVSDNGNNNNTNIGDLIKYIQYNNFEVVKSDIYSVFDMLYSSYTERRKIHLKKYKKISGYDSENLFYSIIIDVLNIEEFSKFDVIIHQPLNSLIRDPKKLNDEECNYAMNSATHIDFLIFNKIDKSPVLAVEVDGYTFHKKGTRQSERDTMKDKILEKYSIPLIRFSTTGSMEKEKLVEKLRTLVLSVYTKEDYYTAIC